MGGSQFQVVKIYANAKGIELGKDITVVNANFAVARAQLEADRVEAALVIEPLASIILQAESELEGDLQRRAGLEGDHRAGRLGDRAGDARGRDRSAYPTRPKMLLAALQDVAKVMHNETDGGRQDRRRDRQAAARHSQGRGRQQAAPHDRQAGLGARPPASRSCDMMERAVKAGFYQKMPDDKIIYAP